MQAQSYLLASGNLDLGILSSATFQNGVLRNSASTSTAFGMGLEYRFRNLFALEGGIAQNIDKLRFQDPTFEENFTAHSFKYSQRSAYLNYYVAVQIFVPIKNNAWLYGKCAYSIPIDRAETISETYEYEILKANINRSVIATGTFGNRKEAIIPELGIQTKLGNSFFSFGMKLNFSQSNLISGTYQLSDNQTGETIRTEGFTSNGNSFSFQARLCIPLKEFVRGKPVRPKEKPEKIEEEKEEIIAVLEEEEKEELKKDKADIVRDEKGAPTFLNEREILKTKTVTVRADSITIKVWDNGKEVDGDSISLNLNGEWILKDYRLQRKQLIMRIPLERRTDNFLILYALNLGTAPPNTAAVIVYDGKQQKILRLVSDMNTCGAINIVNK